MVGGSTARPSGRAWSVGRGRLGEHSSSSAYEQALLLAPAPQDDERVATPSAQLCVGVGVATSAGAASTSSLLAFLLASSVPSIGTTVVGSRIAGWPR